jgi:hypothetical protein
MVAPIGRYLRKPARSSAKVDVEHHHHEQKQHENRADIDHDEDHRQELGAKLHEQAGGIEESEDQEQHGVNRILHGNHHEGRAHAHNREQIEKQCAQHSAIFVTS